MNCNAYSIYWTKDRSVKIRTKGFSPDERNPLLVHDMNRCILCGRCVRACNELRGVKVLQYQKNDMEVYVGTLHNQLLKDADCRFCLACAEVCPTGTIGTSCSYIKNQWNTKRSMPLYPAGVLVRHILIFQDISALPVKADTMKLLR